MSPSEARVATGFPVGPVLLLASLRAGIALGARVGPSSARPELVLGMMAGVVAILLMMSARPRAALCCACLAAIVVGSAVTSRALDGVVHSPLAAAVRERADAVVDVTLVDEPEATRFSTRVLARVRRVQMSDGAVGDRGKRTVTVDASGPAAGRLAVLEAGDRVRLDGYFRPLDEFEARLRWRHAVGAFAADDLRDFAGPAGLLLPVANAVRARVLAGHRRMPEPQRALVAGFLLGDTGGLPDAVVLDFRQAGLSHLVAVSGQNVV